MTKYTNEELAYLANDKCNVKFGCTDCPFTYECDYMKWNKVLANLAQEIQEYRKLGTIEELAQKIDVIHCRDCEFFRNYDEKLDSGECNIVGVGVFHRSHEFCSLGKRKEKED